jgi:hypothetical protein
VGWRDELRTVVGNVVGILPVDHTARPLDSTLGHGGNTSGPDGELNACRSRGVLIHTILEGVGPVDGTNLLVVDKETEGVGLPVDGIVVVVCICVSQVAMSLTVSGRV